MSGPNKFGLASSLRGTRVVYEGWVRHRRFEPVEHAFRYPLSLVYSEVEADEVLDLVEERTGRRPAGPVRLLTQPRRFGVGFNPVSFYFCFDGDRVAAVAAEVTNTPWGERHTYVLDGRDGFVGKRLHVSPFLGMDGSYAWRVSEPGETLQVHIENREAERRVFDATLSLRRRERARLHLGPLGVLARIYVQAARLKLRGVPVHPHP
jgi:DUF1365 family protein